jgi:hypothetical protein
MSIFEDQDPDLDPSKRSKSFPEPDPQQFMKQKYCITAPTV